MTEHNQKRTEQLLKKALPPVDAALQRDLWPPMLKRMDDGARPTPVPWFDWALLAAVAAWLASFPGTIPVLLYHL
jgi:hypothetical protein